MLSVFFQNIRSRPQQLQGVINQIPKIQSAIIQKQLLINMIRIRHLLQPPDFTFVNFPDHQLFPFAFSRFGICDLRFIWSLFLGAWSLSFLPSYLPTHLRPYSHSLLEHFSSSFPALIKRLPHLGHFLPEGLAHKANLHFGYWSQA